MLFDLRGRGRRRTVQVIYLFLAVLIGGGLVFFGVGGTGVGLFNTNNNSGGGGSGNSVLEKQLTRAEKAVKVPRPEAGAWANLARVRFQVASSGGNRDSNGTYQPHGLKELRAAGAAWQRYLELNPKRVDVTLAQQMTNAYSELGDAKGAVGALEVLAERQPSSGVFQRLAVAAYAAKQPRKGDLATAEAVKRTAKAARAQVRARLQAAKTPATQGAGGGVPPTSTVPVTPKPKG